MTTRELFDGAMSYADHGRALFQSDRLHESASAFDKAIAVRPDCAELYNDRGVVCRFTDQISLSAAAFSRAVQLDPRSSVSLANYGSALLETEQSELAVPRLLQAVSLDPSCHQALGGLGMAHGKTLEHERALEFFDKAAVLAPEAVESHNNLSGCLNDLGRHQESLSPSARALAIRPDHTESLNNRALSYRGMVNPESGLPWATRAITSNPLFWKAVNTRAVLLFEARRFDEAATGYQRTLQLMPSFAEAHWNKGLMSLLLGNYVDGWREYQWRLKIKDARQFHQWANMIDDSRVPVSAESMTGKTVLIFHEQGLGDTIQFCRYLRLASSRGLRVVSSIPTSLLRLLRGQGDFGELIKLGDAVPAYDVHCPMMSLPLAFGTTLETIPFGREAYLRALPEEVERWRDRLSRELGCGQGGGGRLRVGVVWNGGFRAHQPELWAVNERRNVPLELFAQALDIEGIDFVSLQKGDPAESEIRGREGEYWKRGRLYNYTSELSDFADTAGWIW